jgi:pimeloyl-ACP methyl ester carboxylesterase
MVKVRTATLEISYSDSGRGEPVLLLHGWPDSARGWNQIRNGLVATGYRVIVPDLRGSGGTRFLDEATIRDGTEVALAQDVLDLADVLALRRFAVVGHDWGARVAYTLAAVAPVRLTSITALGVQYQPRGEFAMGSFDQARRFWYQWLMYLDAGAEAIARDPLGFARIQWDTWSPSGWFDDAEFAATARSFGNPDWVAITLSAYRSRFLDSEPRDPRFSQLRGELAATEHIRVPTLMIHGGADACDPPVLSEGLEHHFDDYRRIVLDGVGHFPHREAPDRVLDEIRTALS